MKIKRFLISTAVTAVLTLSSVASAQVLGGGASGGLGGSITGGLGNIGATGNGAVNGTLGVGSDALGRTRDAGSRIRDKGMQIADRASSTTGTVTATASGALSATVDSAANATNAVSATADAAGNAGSEVNVPNGDQTSEPPMLNLAGEGSGNGSGMLDLSQGDASEPVEVADHQEPSGRQTKRGERRQEPIDSSPKGVVGHALMQGQGSVSAEASRGEPAFDDQSSSEKPRQSKPTANAKADGKTSGGADLQADGNGKATANANASSEAQASVDR